MCVLAAGWFASKGYSISSKYKYILASRDDWHQNIILPEVAEVKVEPHPYLASARYKLFQGEGWLLNSREGVSCE